MSIIQTADFNIPNDETVIKKIKDACVELSASMARVEGEKLFQKEALTELAEATEVPKKYLSKIARLYHRQNKDEVSAEAESTVELYDRIFDTVNE